MGKCRICKVESPLISSILKVCLKCIRESPEEAVQEGSRAHERSRLAFSLPLRPPETLGGIRCGQCANDCSIGKGEKGYCGIVENSEGRLIRHGGTTEKGILEWYYDPLPTNCVSAWFCPAGQDSNTLNHANKAHAERGMSNLAVFYGSCSADCLFCQNWHYRNLAQRHDPMITAEELASKADENTSCICFFGGDPSTQMPHALETSRIALESARSRKRVPRICWETNGRMTRNYAQKAARLSLKSSGNLKFDIKAWHEPLIKTLCGISNEATLTNFRMIGEGLYDERPELPLLSASTLLVPGYVDAIEVRQISQFIATINPSIPYTLLAFHPSHMLSDLPTSGRVQVEECYRASKMFLENVRISNVHLIS